MRKFVSFTITIRKIRGLRLIGYVRLFWERLWECECEFVKCGDLVGRVRVGEEGRKVVEGAERKHRQINFN